MITDPISLGRLNTLHPVAIPVFTRFFEQLEAISPYRWRVTAGYRSIEEQDKLFKSYKQDPGRAAKAAPPGSSYHNYGLAVDVLPMSDDYKRIETIRAEDWDMVGIVAKHHGLIWGASFGDKPHVEMHPHGYTVKTLSRWLAEGRVIPGSHLVAIPPF